MRSSLCLLSFLLAACSAIIEPDQGRLGREEDAGGIRLFDSGMPGRDAGPPIDAGRRDAGIPGDDAGRFDAGRFDAGATCVPGCIGETLVTCTGGAPTTTQCQDLGAYCEGTSCVPWMCTPGEILCTPDLGATTTCDARGSGTGAIIPCENGCNPTTGECASVVPTCTGATPITVGTSTIVNLCSSSDGATYQVTPGCDATVRADSGDATFVLTLTETTNVVIELTDADFSTAIDTVVYVRRVCTDQASQIACDDDVPCSESTVPNCSGSFEVRQARIRTTLGPGTYYIVADAFLYSIDGGTTYRCGNVRLSVRAG